MSNLPVTTTGIRKKLPKIKEWLTLAGAEVLEPTNEWELLRFRANGQTCVVYVNKRDLLTMDKLTTQAMTAYFNGTAWKAQVKTRGRRTSVDEITIRKRDGDDCFFCCEVVEPGEGSIEHLVAVSAGGPNHISNKFLAHPICNQRAGSQPAPQKIAIHDKAKKEKYRREFESRIRQGAVTDAASHLPLAGMREADTASEMGLQKTLVHAAVPHPNGHLERLPAGTGNRREAEPKVSGRSGRGPWVDCGLFI